MDAAALDYPLDPAQIAQRPLAARDGGRLMVVDRGRGVAAHSAVRDLARWLRPSDLVVVNDAEVMPARLHGRRASGGAIEVLLSEPCEDGANTWRCLARRAGRVRDGERIRFAADLEGVWCGRLDSGPLGTIRLEADGELADVLRRRGELPLPPYILRPNGPLPEDHTRYQTVFARVSGAVAAPTAGLHFTPALFATLAARDVEVVRLTLLVGPATFLPLRDGGGDSVPAERYDVPPSTAVAIDRARAAGRRIVAVGTTTVRALESVCGDEGAIAAGPGRTALRIGPGYCFRAVDAVLTNLHLPRSSLLALVAAFAGVAPTLAAYRAASAGGYRFYSYGDAMLLQ